MIVSSSWLSSIVFGSRGLPAQPESARSTDREDSIAATAIEGPLTAKCSHLTCRGAGGQTEFPDRTEAI